MVCCKCSAEIPDNSVFCNQCGKKQAASQSHKPKTRGNGTGSVYKLPNGKWRAIKVIGYYMGEDGKKHKKTVSRSDFKTKKEAMNNLPLLNGEMRKQDITIADLYKQWSDTHFRNIGKSKISTYKTAYKKISKIYFSKIRDLRLNDLQPIVDDVKGAFYPKQDVKVLLNNLYRYAMINDYCEKNYAEYIKLPPLDTSKKDAFNSEEIQKLWNDYENGNLFTGYVLIMIYTGMRYGEIAIITRDCIHLDKQYMVGGIKTEAGKNRQILIANKILPIVTDLYNTGNQKLMDIPKEQFYDKYWEMIDRTGVRKLTPHCCRHTCATALAEEGIPPATIKEILGHRNYSTTLGYTHISLENKLAAINKI